MNQLDLILENIRLSHTERLLMEAQTDLELIRGQRLINESVMAIREALLQEAVLANENHTYDNYYYGYSNNNVNTGYSPDSPLKMYNNINKQGPMLARGSAAGAGGFGTGAGAGIGASLGLLGDDENSVLLGTGVGAGIGGIFGAGLGYNTRLNSVNEDARRSMSNANKMRSANVANGLNPDGTKPAAPKQAPIIIGKAYK